MTDRICYTPKSPEAVSLFAAAARQIGAPEAWADPDSGLHELLGRESGGWVGRPNYHFGFLADTSQSAHWPEVWDAIRGGTWRNLIDMTKVGPKGASSATGLGQLTSSNVPAFYPSGLAGIGVAIEEAAGMLRYIRQRYGEPGAALAFHKRSNWY